MILVFYHTCRRSEGGGLKEIEAERLECLDEMRYLKFNYSFKISILRTSFEWRPHTW